MRREKGNRLVYAMRITNVLDMNDYFDQFPSKRPDPAGTFEQRRGDNIYYSRDGQWRRAPSLEHNTVENFRQDCGRTVYLAEGAENYWYFGAEGACRPSRSFLPGSRGSCMPEEESATPPTHASLPGLRRGWNPWGVVD